VAAGALTAAAGAGAGVACASPWNFIINGTISRATMMMI